jgi:hypothetical protein
VWGSCFDAVCGVVVPEPVFEGCGWDCGGRGDEGEVFFFGLVQPELFTESGGGFGGAGKDEYAGDHGIEPTDYTQENSAGFLKSAANIVDSEFEGGGLTGRGAHGGEWSGFIDDVEVIVFVEDLHGIACGG